MRTRFGGSSLARLVSCFATRITVWMASHGVWRSLVARFVRDEEAAGSNPVTPTVFPQARGPYQSW